MWERDDWDGRKRQNVSLVCAFIHEFIRHIAAFQVQSRSVMKANISPLTLSGLD